MSQNYLGETRDVEMKILAVFRGLMTLLALFIGGQTLATEYKIKVGSPLSPKIEIDYQLDAIGSNGLAIILKS